MKSEISLFSSPHEKQISAFPLEMKLRGTTAPGSATSSAIEQKNVLRAIFTFTFTFIFLQNL
jgi:hypothetical protein